MLEEEETWGFFASGTPVRPNTIGLTLVELVKRKEKCSLVYGLDALNDSPVLND
jgi:tRNA (Thr-GGU) A37 N-methylase